jgi:hypothetical protein
MANLGKLFSPRPQWFAGSIPAAGLTNYYFYWKGLKMKYSGAFEELRTQMDFSRNFYTLSLSEQGIVHETAKQHGYRKPKNANGSLARYFFALLKRRFTN